jgi:hypothetical protein
LSNGRKRGKPKEKDPEWMGKVDRDMFLRLTWERVIKQQENLILTHELSGMRTTPVYVLREGSSGGESVHEAERIAIDIEFAETKIAAGKKYIADLEETVKIIAAGDPNKETFIRLYWWTGINRHIGPRKMIVVEALRFLAHREWGTSKVTGANQTFYDWRTEIYAKLRELLGYGEELKGG